MRWYKLIVYSKVGLHSEILQVRHVEMTRHCFSVEGLCETIKLIAQTYGWRDFEIETKGTGGIPLCG
jgi:hypothetical protein